MIRMNKHTKKFDKKSKVFMAEHLDCDHFEMVITETVKGQREDINDVDLELKCYHDGVTLTRKVETVTTDGNWRT